MTPPSQEYAGVLVLHMEDEDDQENEKEVERDDEEWKVESRRESKTTIAHEAWMT